MHPYFLCCLRRLDLKMVKSPGTLLSLTVIFFVTLFGASVAQVQYTTVPTVGYSNVYSTAPGPTEHPGGIITNDKLIFYKSKSPYRLRNDIIVERNAELIIEAGVEIKIEPQVGITVRGVLTAVVSENIKNNSTFSKNQVY